MTDRERLIDILSKPIYPREGVDKAEVVADYLLDQGVSPVVRCKDCKHCAIVYGDCVCDGRWDDFSEGLVWVDCDDFCSYGERRTDGTEID